MENDKVQHPVWFPQWGEVLPHLHLPAVRQQQYRFAIIQYLRFCKQTGPMGQLLKIEFSLHAAGLLDLTVNFRFQELTPFPAVLATQSGMTNQWLSEQGLVSIQTLWVAFHYPPNAAKG